MENRLVSAIITTHNRSPDVVLRAVNSALIQTYKNIEIIVVDDSSDRYPLRDAVKQAICETRRDIYYIRHEKSEGACAARNTGLAHAKGYYIAFLDDDDEWLPTKIEEQIKGFTNDEIALVYSGYRVIDEIGNEKFLNQMDYRSGNVFHDLLIDNFIGGTSNPLIKKECIDEIGDFDLQMKSAQDYDFWLRLAKKYPINYVSETLLNYHVHNSERISSDVDKQLAGHQRIITKYNDYIEKDAHIWYMKHRVFIRLYLEKGWKKKAFLVWLRCTVKRPFYFIKNGKRFMLILFGVDSSVHQKYGLIKRRVSLLLHKKQRESG